MKLYGREFTKDELRQRVGDISQIAGITDYTLNEGRAKGVHGLDVRTGSGFQFTVLPGRGMDIAWMEKSGYPIGYIGKGGVTNSKYYDPQGYEWLRGFFGGVLTTCGLTNAGPPSREGTWDLGLHGRISNTPAEEVSYSTKWEGDDLVLSMEGKMREAVIFSENITLTRRISTWGGENKLILRDTAVNEGFEECPFMILYHMNLGFPLVSEQSRLCAPIIYANPRDEEARKGIENYATFEGPTEGYKEQVFFHAMAKDKEGNTCAGIINESINLGFYIRYNCYQLPFMTQWKMMGQQDYVVGIEPGNCIPIGRQAMREKGELVMLKPGEKREIEIEIGVLSTWEEIQGYKSCVEKLLKQYRVLSNKVL